VSSKRLIVPICLFLALLFALSGQVRAADAPSLGDRDDVTFSASDDAVTGPAARFVLSPPLTFTRALLPPLAAHVGRLVIAELFRPPIAA
jgi:hypothetical protein